MHPQQVDCRVTRQEFPEMIRITIIAAALLLTGCEKPEPDEPLVAAEADAPVAEAPAPADDPIAGVLAGETPPATQPDPAPTDSAGSDWCRRGARGSGCCVGSPCSISVARPQGC